MTVYLKASIEEANGDPTFIARVLENIAITKGISQVTRDDRLFREGLDTALSGERSPGFDTILKVTGALGLKLHDDATHTLSNQRPNWVRDVI